MKRVTRGLLHSPPVQACEVELCEPRRGMWVSWTRVGWKLVRERVRRVEQCAGCPWIWGDTYVCRNEERSAGQSRVSVGDLLGWSVVSTGDLLVVYRWIVK